MSGRFETFTDRARKVMLLAEEEARGFDHNYIGAEHIVLGLVRERDGLAARVLLSFGVGEQEARDAVMYVVGRGEPMAVEQPRSLTERAKRALGLAVEEARQLKHHYVGTEHLLLGILREEENVGAGVLEGLGVTAEKARAEILLLLAMNKPRGVRQAVKNAIARRHGTAESDTESAEPRGNVITCRVTDRDLDAIDGLVESGIRTTRSDAASWLIGAGIEAHQELFDKIYATIAQIRQLRAEAQALVSQSTRETTTTGMENAGPPEAEASGDEGANTE
ncbi:MAG: Clp protease N-terminal domain-containing protein [Thermomicrobiales bacterium]